MEKLPPVPIQIPAYPLQRDYVMRGIIHAIAAYFLFTFMQAGAKILSDTHSVIEITFYRNLIGLIPLMIFMKARGDKIFEKPVSPFFVFLRVLLGAAGVIVTFGAVKYLPMAEATVIFFTGILLAPALAYFFLKEHIGLHRWGAILVGLAGVTLMLKPSGEGQLLGFILAFTAAFMQGSTAVILRHLRSENALSVTFYFLLCGVVLSGFFMPFVAKIPEPSSWMLFLLVGCAGAMGQYFITRALASAPASVVVPFGYSGLIWASAFDIVLWGYLPGWPVYAGGALIIASNFYIGHRERLAEKRLLQGQP